MKKTLNRRERRARQKQDKEKLKSLKRQAKTPPINAESGIKLGDELVAAREWLDAIHCYQAVLKRDKNNAPLLAKFAYACASIGFTGEALLAYLGALEIEPENSEFLRNIGTIYNAIGKPNRALQYFDRAIALQPEDADCHYMLGEAYRLLKQQDKSAPQYVLAVQLFRKQKLDPASLIKVGRSLGFLRRYEAAINIMQEATRFAPDMPGGHFELASLYLETENLSKAARSYRRTLELAPGHSGALAAYAGLMAKRGQLANTAWAYRRLLQLFPDDASIRHMLAASSQQNVSGETDEAYVKDVFDNYADRFEEHLVDKLSYHTPEELRELVGRHWHGTPLAIMDLGCGTGLCGPLFKPLANRLVGVDLSKGMLAQAETKGVYDELILSELVSALEQEYQTQDLLIAADVLIYVGELEPVFKASQQALSADGQFVFSIETMGGSGFKLSAKGRYQHSGRYIQDLADKYRFLIKQQQLSDLRTESLRPVRGELYLLEKSDND